MIMVELEDVNKNIKFHKNLHPREMKILYLIKDGFPFMEQGLKQETECQCHGMFELDKTKKTYLIFLSTL